MPFNFEEFRKIEKEKLRIMLELKEESRKWLKNNGYGVDGAVNNG